MLIIQIGETTAIEAPETEIWRIHPIKTLVEAVP
jgi:hypothetical protein